MRGGRSWFAVDSKSFEISVDVFREKLKGIIVERSRGFTSWIRFGSLSLCCLLEGVEACCRGELAKRFVKTKKYCLVFSGKGILGGWALLAEKLRSLGVLTQKRRLGEVVWLQLGEKDVLSGREFLSCWLQTCPLWAVREDLTRTLKKGKRFYTWKGETQKWGVFKIVSELRKLGKIGEVCGGFVAVDEDTAAFKELQWARILVKYEGLEWPSSLQVVVSSSCLAIQLWLEVQPRVSEVAWCSEVVVTCEVGEACCRKDREAATFDFVSARRGFLKGPTLVGRSSGKALKGAKARRALMEEASRYTNYHPCSLFSLGKRDFSSSTPSRDGAIVTTDGDPNRECRRRIQMKDFDIAENDEREKRSKREGLIRKILEWEAMDSRVYGLTTIGHLPMSHHFPILLNREGLRRGPSTFRFENMWLKVEGFKNLMKSWWEGDNFSGSSSFILCETLENLDAFALEVSFMEKEVLGTLLGCSGDKALGPNGFSMAFWQFAWDFVKNDVMIFFHGIL
ncbi:hypothetical protein AAG906_041204 [Vitis piasezkii]